MIMGVSFMKFLFENIPRPPFRIRLCPTYVLGLDVKFINSDALMCVFINWRRWTLIQIFNEDLDECVWFGCSYSVEVKRTNLIEIFEKKDLLIFENVDGCSKTYETLLKVLNHVALACIDGQIHLQRIF